MAIIYNGIKCETIEHLEELIVELSEEQKLMLRNDFNGIPNTTELSQKDKDFQKYLKRAAAKDKIIAEMASENMGRVRAGIWTVQNLVDLTQDVELKRVLDDISTLSFELAAQKLQAINNPLLTTEIKNSWLQKLMSNFYNT